MKSTIKTFEDACKALKLDPKEVVPEFKGMPEKHRIAMIAHVKLVIIAEALNKGWTPDWENRDQYKWYPYFRMSTAGSGFSNTDFVYWITDSFVGSRLCYKSEAIAEYAGKQFEDLYKEYFTINK